MAEALVLDGVSKVYEVGGIELIALHDVDLTVAQEEVVTLLGPSGSGKTTLLSIAGGLLSATSGKVIVGGKNITRARARKLTAFRRKRIGFIFQAVNLVPFLTARENLLVVAELARRDRTAAAQRADRLLDELGLGHRLNNLPAQLSGGERQRVAIGRALMNQPALVLVDEPTSALDSDLGQQVMELIVSEVKARGAAAVIVTHDQRMARYGDRILTMADGRIAGMAPRPEFTHNRGATPPPELNPGRPLRALPAAARSPFPTAPAAPASGQFPATGTGYGTTAGDRHAPAARHDPAGALGQWPATADVYDPAAGDGPGFGPRTGKVPAAGSERDGVPVGLWANGPAVSRGTGAGPASGQWPAAGDGRGAGAATGPIPAAGRAGGSGEAGSGWPTVDERAGGRERKEVPAGLWANGPAVTPGAGTRTGSGAAGHGGDPDWGAGEPGSRPPKGQVPATGRRPDPYDGLPGPREEAPAAYDRSPTGPSPIVPPISAQTPVVPDRVWRRPATPPASARPGGSRRPPQLRPVQPASPSQPQPPADWPEPQLPEPEAPAGPPPEPARWGTPEFFAEPPQSPAYPPTAPAPQVDDADPVESDRVRWLQQLTPPPTKAQPRPLALPDRPIWPTRYWDDSSPRPANGADADDPYEAGDPAYDFGEYDDEG